MSNARVDNKLLQSGQVLNMKNFSMILVLISLLNVSASCLAIVNEDIQHEFYSVVIDDKETLFQAINRASPIRHEGKIFHAHTRWHVDWRAQWHNVKENNCEITAIQVDLQTVMRLPRLTQGTPQQHVLFDNYSIQLVNHEVGHHEIGRKAAFAVEKYLLSRPRAKNCLNLQKDIEKNVAAIVKKHSAMDVAYDKKTDHGKKQGAYLADDR
jgi:predicted secreted Zn-dependent protease